MQSGKPSRKDVIAWQIEQVKQISAQHPNAKLAIATYTKEEFAELRKREDYDAFKREERLFIEGLAKAGLLDRIAIQPIDAAGYWRWLSKNPQIQPGDSARSAYAAELYRLSQMNA